MRERSNGVELAGDRANLSELDTSFSLLHSAVSYQVVKHLT